jgi:hypothetical protein
MKKPLETAVFYFDLPSYSAVAHKSFGLLID